MAQLTTTQSGTLLSAVQNIVTKGRADNSNAKFSFRLYCPDSNYPQDWKVLDGVSTVLEVGQLHFTVAASTEAAAATEANRIYNEIVASIPVIRALDITDFKAGQTWLIVG